MATLCVNIDHVASLRQARYRSLAPEIAVISGLAEPDPVRAAHEVELGGADGITVHLREDRRHITDADVERLAASVRIKLNFEMAPTDEMVRIAVRTRPHMAMLVPEGRMEVTTEGGLNVVGLLPRLKETVARLRDAGVSTSAFIDADARQVEAARAAGFDTAEVHTGPYALAFHRAGGDTLRGDLMAELERVAMAGAAIASAGMRFNAGHALNYANAWRIASLPGVRELHIGHAIVSRAVYTGLRDAVRDMKTILARAPRHEGA